MINGQYQYRDYQGRLMAIRAKAVRDGASVAASLSESLGFEVTWHPAA